MILLKSEHAEESENYTYQSIRNWDHHHVMVCSLLGLLGVIWKRTVKGTRANKVFKGGK